jgi:hypothetical protein
MYNTQRLFTGARIFLPADRQLPDTIMDDGRLSRSNDAKRCVWRFVNFALHHEKWIVSVEKN